MTAAGSQCAFKAPVASIDELREIVGDPGDLAVRKEIHHLDKHCRTFIAHAPFVLVATSAMNGQVDVSPRGDAPGFVQVLDDHTLLVPDRPGNKRVDSFRNVVENPHAGLLFIIPGVEETLRVNGRAQVIRDPDLLARMGAQGKLPQLALAVQVEEAFLQCAKSLRRSRLWQQETWPERSQIPTMGQMLLDQARMCDASAEELDCQIEESYSTRLY